MSALWDHHYAVECPHLNANVTTTYAESTMTPAEVSERFPTMERSCGCVAEYSGSEPHADDGGCA